MGSGGRRAVKSTGQVRAGEQQTRAAVLGGEEKASVMVRPRSWQGWWWAAGGGRSGRQGGRAVWAQVRRDTLGLSTRMKGDRTGATGSPNLQGTRMVLIT